MCGTSPWGLTARGDTPLGREGTWGCGSPWRTGTPSLTLFALVVGGLAGLGVEQTHALQLLLFLPPGARGD